MTLNKFQQAVVVRYAHLVFAAAIKTGAKPVEAKANSIEALERAYARFQAKNWSKVQRELNDSMLGQVRWS